MDKVAEFQRHNYRMLRNQHQQQLMWLRCTRILRKKFANNYHSLPFSNAQEEILSLLSRGYELFRFRLF